ncbi:preprotein translocase subunit [Nannochloropsis oceanica]
MKLLLSLLLLGAIPAQGFLLPTPLHSTPAHAQSSHRRQKAGALKAVVDPNEVAGFVQTHLPSSSQWLLQTLQGVADAAVATAPDAAAAVENGKELTGAAAAAAANNGGWLAAPIGAIEKAITFMHEGLQGAGLTNTYGLSIIAFTVLVKLVTLPLNYKQIESTTKMQAIQPKMKEIQAKYKSDPTVQQQKMAQLYSDNNVNPLAGCLPALVQIPIFISLYRALTNLAAQNELNEPFLWLPNLEGPTYGAGPADGMNWLKQWEGFTPSLGWHDTIAFLTIPLILIVSQSISQQILQPTQNKDDPSAAQSQAILKFLPFMVGYFSLNVPSGLGVYWIANNLITTLTTVAVRAVIQGKEDAAASLVRGGESAPAEPAQEQSGGRVKKTGFGKAPPPPPAAKKGEVEDVDDELSSAAGGKERKFGGLPAVGISNDERMGRTEKGSTVEVLKQEGGLTVLREVKDGSVVSTTVRLTPEEMKRRREALERGEDPAAVGPPSPTLPEPSNDPRQNKRSKRQKKK